MGLDALHVRDLEARDGKGHFSSRDRRCRHKGRLYACKTIGDDLYFYLGIRTELFCPIPRGDNNAAIAVRGERLGTKAMDAPGPYRFQIGQALGRGWGP